MTQKSADEQRDVFLSIAQRRHCDAHDVQAKEKIVAKFSLAHERLEILVCCGDQPHIRAQGLIAPNTLEGALFTNHAQQFDLCARTDLGHFIEKNRAAAGLLEAADPAFMCASECALLVPE